MSNSIKLAIIGLGYVGLPLAVEFGKKRDVIGFDTNVKRIEDLNDELSKENATKDMERYKKISKEHSDILPIVEIYKNYLRFDKDISDAKEMLNDSEMKNFAQTEIDNGKVELKKLNKNYKNYYYQKILMMTKIFFLK